MRSPPTELIPERMAKCLRRRTPAFPPGPAPLRFRHAHPKREMCVFDSGVPRMNREKIAWTVSVLLIAILAFQLPHGMAQRDNDYAFVRTLVDIHRQVSNN